ncbi:MAG: inositol monophosphatase family protein [Rhodothermales bacterium]
MLEFALELALRAEKEILSRFRNVDVLLKPDGTVVTEADRAAERLMREIIGLEFPDDGILGEEYGESFGQTSVHTPTDAGQTGSTEDPRPSPGRRWILDPIDGTAAFTLGLPTFGTLIALEEDGEPIVGVIHFPGTGETVYAATGMGCWYRTNDGHATQVHCDASVNTVEDAYLSATGVYDTLIDPRRASHPIDLGAAIRRAGRFRFVGDCTQHALVARGFLHGAIDPEMHPWDNAAIIPCIREAGGAVSTALGQRTDLIHAPSLVSAASEPLLAAILAVLNP